jgi:hypothetical protein
MKKAILILALLFAGVTTTTAQEKPKTEQSNKKSDPVIGKHKENNGKVYDLYQGPRGGKYILVTSREGNVYKKYIK